MRPGVYLLFEQMMSQNAAGEHAKQMEELCNGDKNITRANQIVLRDNRMKVGFVLKFSAGYHVRVAMLGHLPDARLLCLVLVVVIVMGMLLCILIDIAKIDAKLLIVLFLLLWMRYFDPLRLILIAHGWRRLAEEFTVSRCWCSENDACHEP